MKSVYHIVIAEPPGLILDGLFSYLSKQDNKYQISISSSINEITTIHIKKRCSLVILNPSMIQNDIKLFTAAKARLGNVIWVSLVYSYFEKSLLSLFDASITISDSHSAVEDKISGLLSKNDFRETEQLQGTLSERETDVLIQLASGLSNREIADKLHISINTVMTHRRNISIKTGIKTVAGLTIFAVLKKLISLNNN